MKRKLRVLVLMHEDLVPPESVAGYDEKQIAQWATEYDVIAGLQELGHDVYQLGVGSDLRPIREAFAELKPHLAFNLLVHFHGVGVYDQHVVSYLELLKKRYTGCNPRGMMLARDKAISKQILAYHRIRAPRFQVMPTGRRVKRSKRLRFPLLVKSLNEEASLGLSQASVVTSDERLEERVAFMHDSFAVDVIVEEYVEGRELYVGVTGNQRLETFPVWELTLGSLPDSAPRIATAKVKWDLDYQRKYRIATRVAAGLSGEVVRDIQRLCGRVYRALYLSGFARMDLRLSETGQVYVLEANPNPDLKRGDDFADSAAAHGLSYPELLQRILSLGMGYQAEWRR